VENNILNQTGNIVPVGAAAQTAMTEAVRNWNMWWRNAANGQETFLAAQRRVPRLTLSTVEAYYNLPELRSGYVINSLGAGGAVHSSRPLATTLQAWTSGTTPATGLTTGRTGIIRVQENVLNALDLSRGRPVTFEVPDGVIITGVEWRYMYGDAIGFNNVTHARGTSGLVERPALNLGQASADQNVLFTDNTVTLRPNPRLHDTHGVRSNLIRLEVRLYVSVEAGFAGGELDKDLVVTVSGPGVANLPENAREVVVATVYDPVIIEHYPGPVEIDLVGREQNIYHTDAGRITITETEGGMLQRGTELRIGVVRHYGNQIGFPLVLSRGDVVYDPGSNLGLRVERVETPGLGNEAVTWITVRVVRESAEGYPGSITFDNLTLFGHVYQGERYYLVVTGPAIAENHWGIGNGGGVNNATNPLTVGVFTRPPYHVEIIEIVSDDVTHREFAPTLVGTSFRSANTFMNAAQMIWFRATGMEHDGAFIGIRAFADAMGLDQDTAVYWNDSSRVAFVEGWSRDGLWTRVTVTQGSPNALITRDGVAMTVDIGLYSGGRTGAPTTVVPTFRYDRIYLPFRFMFYAFGYGTDYSMHGDRPGDLVTITAN